MVEPEPISIQAYERPVARLQALEHEVSLAFKGLLQGCDAAGRPPLRQLAFLEGLRQQRDDAREALRQIETEIFLRVVAQLGIPSPETHLTE